MKRTYLISAFTSVALVGASYASDLSHEDRVDAARNLTMVVPSSVASGTHNPPPAMTAPRRSTWSKICSVLSCMGSTAAEAVAIAGAIKGDPKLTEIGRMIGVEAKEAGNLGEDSDLTLSGVVVGGGQAAVRVLGQTGQRGVAEIVDDSTQAAARVIQRNGLDTGLPKDPKALVADVIGEGLHVALEHLTTDKAAQSVTNASLAASRK